LQKKWSLVPKNVLERRVWQFYTICEKKSASKSKKWKSYGNFSTRMAGFQLAGPAADVSKHLYSKNRRLYGAPKRTIPLLDIVLRVRALVRFAKITIQILDTSARAGPAG
jgi:hypothetical protein